MKRLALQADIYVCFHLDQAVILADAHCCQGSFARFTATLDTSSSRRSPE